MTVAGGRTGPRLIKVIVGEVGRPAGRGRRPRAERPDVTEWALDWAGGLPPAPAGGPRRVGEQAQGEAGGGLAEADLTLSLSPEDARAVTDGRLAPSVAFMQGRLKTAGDNGLLLEVLAWTAGPSFRAFLEDLPPLD